MSERVGFVDMATYGVRTLFWRPVHSAVFVAVFGLIMIGYYSWAQSPGGMAFFLSYAEASLGLSTGAVGPYFAAIGQMMLVGLIFGAIHYASGYRVLVREDAKPFFPIQLGRDELNFLLLFLVVGLIFLGVVIVAAIVAGIVGVALALALSAGDPEGAAYAGLFTGFVALLPVLYFVGRISVSFPLTIKQRRFTLGGWKASQGMGWSLFFAHLVIYAVMMLVQFVLAYDVMMSSFTMGVDPVTTPDAEALAAQMANPVGDWKWIAAPLQSVLALLMMGPTAAIAAKRQLGA
ncbi:hypothetical protein [Maricaulis sp.]|uniref:hypothetical protein n=1 Tax=Maricaulis sp. TaxID=1486257 RepID=UPI002607C2E2|nr:hypothetical protein [Maricaulis sp.]